MKRAMLIAVLLPVVIAAIAGPLGAVLAVDRNAARLPGLQSLANASCACARRAPNIAGENACWRRFERLTHVDHRKPTGGTACYPLSQAMVWVEGALPITLKYGVVASDGLYLCSKEEAVVGEAIWYRAAMQQTTEAMQDLAHDPAHQALIRFAQALKRGERLETLKPAMGCVTGHN